MNGATVCLNPQSNREDILAQIDKEFRLKGLSFVCVKSDGSAHYRATTEDDEEHNDFPN